MAYSQKYLEHFSAPKNVGELENPDAMVEVEHQGGGCFDRIRLTMNVSDGIVKETQFKARACSGTIAAASAATEWAVGKSLKDIETMEVKTLTDYLDGVPEKKMHSVELAVEALKEAVIEIRNKFLR